MNIQELRKYRVQLSGSMFNKESVGIALFDLVLSYVVAYILEKYFVLSESLPGENKKQTYYLLVVPFGVAVHALMSKSTFLNQQLLSSTPNMYQGLLVLMLFNMVRNMNI